MNIRSLGHRTDLAVLERMGSVVEDCGDHLVVRTPSNPSFYWGNFLVLGHIPGVEDVPKWLQRFTDVIPDARHRAFSFETDGASASDLQGFAAHGLEIETLAVLTASSVDPPAYPNDEATYRALESDDDWAQSIDVQMACNESNEPVGHRMAFVARRASSNRALVTAGHGTWFGAFIGNTLVAQMGLVGVGPELARFQAVETHPAHRRRGIAGTLLHHVGSHGLHEMGARQLVIVADTNYVAIRLYRAVGFADAETQLQALLPPDRDRYTAESRSSACSCSGGVP